MATQSTTTQSAEEAQDIRSPKNSGGHVDNQSKAPRPVGIVAYLLLIALTLGVFSPILRSNLSWTEYDTIDRTPYQSMERLSEAWSVANIKKYDPITTTSYFLEAHLPKSGISLHRLINIILHASAALLLLKILQCLKLFGAYAASLTFALHPAAVQTLFWPGYRGELVGLIFILACLFFALRKGSTVSYVIALVLGLVSALLHPAALALPALMALALFFRNKSFHLHHYNKVLPFACIALFVGTWTQGGQFMKPYPEDLNLLTKAGQHLYFYLKQSFFPVDLQLFHPFSYGQDHNIGVANNLLSFLIFIPFYVLVGFNLQKQWARGLLLGVTGFLLLLVYGILQNGAFIDGSLAKEEHGLYVALPAATGLVLCSLAGFFERKELSGTVIWRTFFTLFLGFQVLLTANYCYALSDSTRMWKVVSGQWEDSWLPKAALVDSAQSSESDLVTKTEMINTLEAILELNPDGHRERILLARLYLDDGQKTNALGEYRQILRKPELENHILEEAANLMDKMGLSREANNARERINTTNTTQTSTP